MENCFSWFSATTKIKIYSKLKSPKLGGGGGGGDIPIEIFASAPGVQLKRVKRFH